MDLEKRSDGCLDEGERASIPLVSCNGALEVDDRSSHGRIKTAASEEAIKIAASVKPDPGRVYVLLIGLGSTESWGPNNNGDGWPEAALLGQIPGDVPMSFFDRYAARLPKKWGYTTFRQAHVFEEHRNSHPKLAIGGIHDTFWNPRMHRVENLIWIDRKKGKQWADLADSGLNVPSSMAARVPFDRCSVSGCGNLAPTRKQYCDHLKIGRPGYSLRQIREDGKPVMMINDFPTFFDESLVKNPAAPEAMSIMKVASAKPATMIKEDLDLPGDIAMDDFPELAKREPKIARVIRDRLAPLGLVNVLAAAEKLGMCLWPSELLEIALGKEASDLGVFLEIPVPAPLDLPSLGKQARGPLLERSEISIMKAARLLEPYVAMRSYSEPHLGSRRTKAAHMPVGRQQEMPGNQEALALYHALYKLAAGNFGYARSL